MEGNAFQTNLMCKMFSQMEATYTTASVAQRQQRIESGNFREKSKELTLQFIGIRKPRNQHNLAYPLGEKSNITSLNVETGLTRNATILDLKQCIKRTYSIPSGKDLFIQYAHTVISMHDNAKLEDFGITNNSLLTVAIIIDERNGHQTGACSHQHISRSLSSTQKTMKKGTVIGLDIITQETDVPLFRMPVCGHLMSRESLYHYANSCIADPSTVYIQCPHSRPTTKEDMSILWESPRITVQSVSEFMQYLPSTFKTKIWNRHCNAFRRYIEPSQILPTLRSFVALFIRLQDRKVDYSSLRTAIEKRLIPFAEAVRTRTESSDGISLQEFNEVLHLWILKPITETTRNTVGWNGFGISNLNGTHYGEQWSCAQCTYLNPKKVSTQCTMCGHERYQKPNGNGKNQCGAVWHYSLIKQILIDLDGKDSKENSQDFNCSKLEALSARNALQYGSDHNQLNVQKCSDFDCNTVHFKYEDAIEDVWDREDYKELETQCVLCSASFCWNCGLEFDEDHVCDSDKLRLFEETVEILEECGTKEIGNVDLVPTIRACPNEECGQLIAHTEACKHMQCETCDLEFCFICLLPKEDGEWQCGRHDDECEVAERQTLDDMFDETVAEITLKKSFQLF